MILLVTIFQGGPVYNEGSSDALWVRAIPIILTVINLIFAFLNIRIARKSSRIAELSSNIARTNSRTAKLSMIQGQLAQKAKECYEMDIDKRTHALRTIDEFNRETDGSVSHAVSNIITCWALIEDAIKNSNGYLVESDKVDLFDQFYLQLHTSIIDFVWKNDFFHGKDHTDQGRFHIARQIAYCKNLFIGPYSRYGNASPSMILDDVKLFKMNRQEAVLKLIELNAELQVESDKLDGSNTPS